MKHLLLIAGLFLLVGCDQSRDCPNMVVSGTEDETYYPWEAVVIIIDPPDGDTLIEGDVDVTIQFPPNLPVVHIEFIENLHVIETSVYYPSDSGIVTITASIHQPGGWYQARVSAYYPDQWNETYFLISPRIRLTVIPPEQ